MKRKALSDFICTSQGSDDSSATVVLFEAGEVGPAAREVKRTRRVVLGIPSPDHLRWLEEVCTTKLHLHKVVVPQDVGVDVAPPPSGSCTQPYLLLKAQSLAVSQPVVCKGISGKRITLKPLVVVNKGSVPPAPPTALRAAMSYLQRCVEGTMVSDGCEVLRHACYVADELLASCAQRVARPGAHQLALVKLVQDSVTVLHCREACVAAVAGLSAMATTGSCHDTADGVDPLPLCLMTALLDGCAMGTELEDSFASVLDALQQCVAHGACEGLRGSARAFGFLHILTQLANVCDVNAFDPSIRAKLRAVSKLVSRPPREIVLSNAKSHQWLLCKGRESAQHSRELRDGALSQLSPLLPLQLGLGTLSLLFTPQ